MTIRSYILGAVLAAPLVLAATAGAHVTLQPGEVPAGGFTRLDVRVPTERDDASTMKVAVQFPAGFESVSTEPVPGWTARVTRAKLAKPVVDDEGEKITDRVDTVTWTATGQGIGPGQFQDFGLSLAVPDKAGSALTFKAVQTYSGGEVVRWIGPPDSESPAPQVQLAAAEDEGGGSAPANEQQPAAADGGGGDGGSDTLSIIALIVGAAGLAAGLVALLRGRGRARVGAA